MTINGVLETYNNAICMETHNQLLLYTIVYLKWSTIKPELTNVGIFRINNKKTKIFISVIHRNYVYFKILIKNTRVLYVHYHLNFVFFFFFAQSFAEADIK